MPDQPRRIRAARTSVFIGPIRLPLYAAFAVLTLVFVANTSAEEVDAAAFARQVEALVATGKFNDLTRLIDFEAHHLRTMGPLPTDATTRKKLFGRGGSGLVIIEQLVREKRARGTMRLLRVIPAEGDDPARLRLRVIDGTRAPVQYIDLLIAQRASDNAWRILDLADDASSEPASVLVRRRLLAGWIDKFPKWKDKLDPMDRAVVRYAKRIALMTQQAHEGKYDAAVALYANLPEPLDGDRDLMRLNAIWSLELGDADKAKAGLHPYIAKFGSDIALQRALLRKGFEFEQWPAAMDAIERIDKHAGGDPYLHVLRGRAAEELGETDKAAVHYATAVAALPTLPEAYYPAIQHALTHKQHAVVTDLLIDAEKQAGVEFGDLTKITAFADYVNSGEYERWKERKKTE